MCRKEGTLLFYSEAAETTAEQSDGGNTRSVHYQRTDGLTVSCILERHLDLGNYVKKKKSIQVLKKQTGWILFHQEQKKKFLEPTLAGTEFLSAE